MKVLINILNLDIIKEVFIKYSVEENSRIYYDLYDNKNKNKILEENIIFEESKENELFSFYENNKLYIQNYNIYTFIDSLLLASIFNYEIVLPDINISEINKLEFIDSKIYNKLIIIDETEYFINFINLIKQNKIYSNLLNFNYKNYFENFMITDISKLLIFIIIKNEHMCDNVNKIKKITDLTMYDNKKMDKFISGLLILHKFKVKIKKYYRVINLLYSIKDMGLLIGYICRSYTEENHDIFDYSIKVYNNFVSEYTDDSIIVIDDIIKLKSITKELIEEKIKEISSIHKKFKEGEDVISIIDYQDCIILLYKFLYENRYINIEKISNEILNKIFNSCLCDIRANKLVGLAPDGNKHNNFKYKSKYENYKKKFNQLKKLFDLINENCKNK
jgi:hypothetical protein